MIRPLLFTLVALAVSAGSTFAQTKIAQGTIQNVSAADAKGMFDS
jgi:hypothetical protein